MAIEIVDLPIENGGSFHRFLYVYQRVHIDTWKVQILVETLKRFHESLGH